MTVLRVAIIGGGIGGLTLAQALRRINSPSIAYTVYERDASPTSRDQGYALGITKTSVDGMRPLFDTVPGLPPLLENQKAVWKPFCMLDMHSNALIKMTAPDGGGLRVDRIKLHAALLHGLDVKWGKQFVRYEAEGVDAVAVVFGDGSREVFDVVVAADGANSNVRKQRAPLLLYNDLGITGAAGTAPLSAAPPAIHSLVHEYGLLRWLGPNGMTLMCFAMPDDDELLWSLSFPGVKSHLDTRFSLSVAPEERNEEFVVTPGDRQPFLSYCLDRLREAGFPSDLVTAVASTPPTPTRLFGPVRIASVDPKTVPTQLDCSGGPVDARVLLLGDASHGTTTHIGQGANVAIADALELSRVLTEMATKDPASGAAAAAAAGAAAAADATSAASLAPLAAWQRVVVARGQSTEQSTFVTGMIHATGWRAAIRPTMMRTMGAVMWAMSGVRSALGL